MFVVGGMNTHAKCWQTTVDSPRPGLFPEARSKIMLLFHKTPPLKRERRRQKTTRAQSRGHLRSPQLFILLFFYFFYSHSPSLLPLFSTPPLIFKAPRLKELPRRPAVSINIQRGPEVRNRRGKAEKNSAMPIHNGFFFSLSFAFGGGDATGGTAGT